MRYLDNFSIKNCKHPKVILYAIFRQFFYKKLKIIQLSTKHYNTFNIFTYTCLIHLKYMMKMLLI